MTDSPPPALVESLRRYRQEHLLDWWVDLNARERRELIAQIENVDFALIERCLDRHRRQSASTNTNRSAKRAARARPPSELVRLQAVSTDRSNRSEWSDADQRGREILAAGRVGVILVAGGQGTRLGFEHPKGMFPIGPVSGCSLFQILAEQLLARSRQAGVSIPYYVMTSDATYDETVGYFEEHKHFGLNSSDVFFFRQGNMPAVDAEGGRVLLSGKGRLSMSPDGHGGLLDALRRSGLVDDIQSRGVEFLFYHQVDNPTVKVCDPAFLGFHGLRAAELSTKVVAKRSADERMGVVVDVDGKTEIIEYSELPSEAAWKTDDAGELLLWTGSTAIHIFNRSLIERLVDGSHDLPFHVAHKAVSHIDETGQLVRPLAPNAYKFERFIFDALPFAERALVVEADRVREFNPVKNETGDDSPATAKAAMTSLFAQWLRAAGAEVDDDALIEISPLFALDGDEVKQAVESGTVYQGPVSLR